MSDTKRKVLYVSGEDSYRLMESFPNKTISPMLLERGCIIQQPYNNVFRWLALCYGWDTIQPTCQAFATVAEAKRWLKQEHTKRQLECAALRAEIEAIEYADDELKEALAFDK
jgi:hypothetical protein